MSSSCLSGVRPSPASAPPSWRVRAAHEDCWLSCLRRGCMPLLTASPAAVLLVWLLALALSCAYGFAFLGLTRADLSVPAGTPSAVAAAAFSALYPAYAAWPPAFIVMHGLAGAPALGAAAANASAALDGFCAARADACSGVAGYYELSAAGPAGQLLADATISASNATMRATLSFGADATLARINAVVAELIPFADRLSTPRLSVAATGLLPLYSQMSHETESNFLLIDATVIPIAILILGVRIRSYRHMALTLINLIAGLVLAFAVLVPVTGVFAINPFSPSVMISLSLALNFDYSLFLLTRFREERLGEGRGVQDAVFEMLASSGHVIILSGSTLTATFILLCFFPENFLISIGISCAVVVVCAMISQLTITPAFLLAAHCLSYFDLLPARDSCCCLVPAQDPIAREAARLARSGGGCGGSGGGGGKVVAAASGAAVTDAAAAGAASMAPTASPAAAGAAEAALPAASFAASGAAAADAAAAGAASMAPSASPAAAGAAAAALPAAKAGALPAAAAAAAGNSACFRGCWFSLTWLSTGRLSKWLLFLLSLAITIPFGLTFLRFQPSSDDNLIYLQGSSTLNALDQMKEEYSLGSLDPYSLLASTGVPGGVWTPGYWAAEAAVVAQLLAAQAPAGYVNSDSIRALTYFAGAPVPLATAAGVYLNASAPGYASARATAWRALAASGVSADGSATLVAVETIINPNSQAIVGFITGVRAQLTAASAAPPAALPKLQWYLVGAYTTTLDVQNVLYALVPAEIGAVFGLVFLIIGFSFGSLALALRLVFTLFLALVWTYGLMVLVYEPGPAQSAFAVLTPTILVSSGVYWLIPIISFSILVGLGVDYDVFLLSRVREYRLAGWSDRAAVCLGVQRSGGVITAAGLIMAVSFVGLLIPKTLVLQQYGFALFIGVLIDTFLMRPIVVPVLLTLGGDAAPRANWWPARMPPIVLTPAEEERALRAGWWHPLGPAAAAAGAADAGDGGKGAALAAQLAFAAASPPRLALPPAAPPGIATGAGAAAAASSSGAP